MMMFQEWKPAVSVTQQYPRPVQSSSFLSFPVSWKDIRGDAVDSLDPW